MAKTHILSEDEQQALLQLAFNSIKTYLESHTLPEHQPEYQSFHKPAAVFVTLTINDQLRGCVGQINANKPLFVAVQDAALSAAFSDPRFKPLTRDELDLLKIKIAILSPLTPISVDEIRIGQHGLMIEHNFRRGLLLPEVASDRGWDKITFLENLCYKANLPPNAWKRAEHLLGFTTELIEMKE